MKEQGKVYLSNLLPYETALKKNGSLQKGLKEYQSLLRALLEASRYSQISDLEKFDSLVGENACEIRAIWLALPTSRGSFIPNDQIIIIIKTIESLLSPQSIDALMRGNKSLEDILEEERLDILLTAEEMFAIQSYLLSEIKTVNEAHAQLDSIYRIEASDPKKIVRFGDISISFARNLISKLRRMLATASVQFVRSCALRLQDQHLIKMVSDEFTVLENTLPCTPMFWTYKTLLLTAQEQEIPLVIHVKFVKRGLDGYTVVDEDCMVFLATKTTPFTEMDPDCVDSDQPACVIQGIALDEDGHCLTRIQWRALMNEMSIVDVILAGAADHRQFPDPALDPLIEALSDSEYTNYKAIAKQQGFSNENPSAFFIQHVYAACVGKIVDEVSLRGSGIQKEGGLVLGSWELRATLFQAQHSRSRPSPIFSRTPSLQPICQ